MAGPAGRRSLTVENSMARVTRRDVARLAGVSIATVSHVINKTRHVNDDTRRKVLDAISALGYHPNAIARGLVTRSTRKIGVVIAEITNPFFTLTTRGIEDEALGYQYNIVLWHTDEDPAREEAVLQLLAAQQIDGLIIAPTGVTCPALLALAESGLPTVQLDRSSPGLAAPLVGVANEEGAYQAVRYLIGLGHRRIACLIDLDVISTQRERRQGWERALREAGLPIDPRLLVRADPRFFGVANDAAGPYAPIVPAVQHRQLPSAYEALQALLRSAAPPSAVFVANNQLTVGALYALRACGFACPDDISLVSFDDHDWAPLFTPPLTIVRQPPYELGQAAAHLLMQMINGEPVPAPPPAAVELVIRGSCAAPPAGGS